MNKIEAIMRRFPRHAYDPDNVDNKLYRLIKAIADELEIVTSNIDRVQNMLSIDTISPDDIYNRFGALLNIPRNYSETDDQYRSRLKTSITALSGGTAEAIKYAIACGLGINDDVEAMKHIQVYDAWEYDGNADVRKEYGYVVCTIDLNAGSFSLEDEAIIIEAANGVKAAGVIIQFVYSNFRIEYYVDLDRITYSSLSTLTYSQVGE